VPNALIEKLLVNCIAGNPLHALGVTPNPKLPEKIVFIVPVGTAIT
jgi:hypothetical protein